MAFHAERVCPEARRKAAESLFDELERCGSSGAGTPGLDGTPGDDGLVAVVEMARLDEKTGEQEDANVDILSDRMCS